MVEWLLSLSIVRCSYVCTSCRREFSISYTFKNRTADSRPRFAYIFYRKFLKNSSKTYLLMAPTRDDYYASLYNTWSDTVARERSKNKGKKSRLPRGPFPCPSFQLGKCILGNNCPFSHTRVEHAARKEICEAFVKGNCELAHKCPQAHMLPGQSIAIDRKNKMAARFAQVREGATGNNQNRTAHLEIYGMSPSRHGNLDEMEAELWYAGLMGWRHRDPVVHMDQTTR